MNHEQKFWDNFKNVKPVDVLLWHEEYQRTREKELGEEEYNRLMSLYRHYKQMIDTEMTTITQDYIRHRLTLNQFKVFQQFAMKPWAGLICADCVEEMEWRWHCLIQRAIPKLYQG